VATHRYSVGQAVHLANDFPGDTSGFPSTLNLTVSSVQQQQRQGHYLVCVKYLGAPGWESEEFDSAWLIPA